MYSLGHFVGRHTLLVLVSLFVVAVLWWSAGQSVAPINSPAPVEIASPVEKPVQYTEGDLRINRAIAFGRSLKAGSKDPSSFKMESFLYFDGGATCYEYRAKNSYAALIPGRAVYDGGLSMLTSERDGNKFVKQWNAICTKGGGVDRIQGLNYLNVW